MSRNLRSRKVGEPSGPGSIVQPATRSAGLLARGRERDLPGSQAIHPVPLPRSTTPAEPTIPRLFDGLVDAAPALPTAKASALMNFGAQSRGFSTRCLRFKSDVATTHARLASGWLARLYREGVEPSGSLQKVSDPPFLDLAWRKGSFIAGLPLAQPLHSITSSARASSVGGTSIPSAFAVFRLITSSYLVGACTGRSDGFSPLRMRST